MANQSFAVIGTDTLTVGGHGVAVVGDVTEDAREYSEMGYEPELSAQLVAKRSAFDAVFPLSSDAYLGKLATFRGRQFRIQSIKRGQAFVEIALQTKNKA